MAGIIYFRPIVESMLLVTTCQCESKLIVQINNHGFITICSEWFLQANKPSKTFVMPSYFCKRPKLWYNIVATLGRTLYIVFNPPICCCGKGSGSDGKYTRRQVRGLSKLIIVAFGSEVNGWIWSQCLPNHIGSMEETNYLAYIYLHMCKHTYTYITSGIYMELK